MVTIANQGLELGLMSTANHTTPLRITLGVPKVQMRKLEPREVTELAQG